MNEQPEVDNKESVQMGTAPEPSRVNGTETMLLLPEEIAVDSTLNVRMYAGDSETENKRVDELSKSIELLGQIDPGVVIESEPGKFTLVSGARRRKAIVLLNDRLGASGRPLERMRVYVDRTGGDMLRKAIHSNLKRKDFSPMDLALLIARLRAENKWEGMAGAKQVAKYLGVSPATVTQHEKLMEIGVEIQDKLHAGVISAQSAFDLLNVKPEKRREVIERAERIESESAPVEPASSTAPELKPAASPKRIKHDSIVKAVRQTPDSTDAPVAKSRREILDYFAEKDGPAYGHLNSAVREFCRYFVESWATGKGTDRTADAKFDGMSQKSFRGTKEKDGPESKSEPKPSAKKKTAEKPAPAPKSAIGKAVADGKSKSKSKKKKN